MINNYIGICEWALPVSGPYAIKLASEIGFDGIQLSEAGGTRMGFPLNNERIQNDYMEASAKYHIILHSLNLGALLQEGTLFYPKNTMQGQYARRSLENGITACKKMNIPVIVCTVSPRNKEELEHAVKHLNYACKLAKEQGITITIESVLPLDQLQALLDMCNGDAKVCMDILNPLRFGSGEPCEQILALNTEYIHHFHMKDSIKRLFLPDQRGCVQLGHGDVGLLKIVNTIKDINYNGWFLSENYYYLPPMNNGNDFFELAKNDLKILRKLL